MQALTGRATVPEPGGEGYGHTGEGEPGTLGQPPDRSTAPGRRTSSGCTGERRDGYEWCDPHLDILLEGWAEDFAREFGETP